MVSVLLCCLVLAPFSLPILPVPALSANHVENPLVLLERFLSLSFNSRQLRTCFFFPLCTKILFIAVLPLGYGCIVCAFFFDTLDCKTNIILASKAECLLASLAPIDFVVFLEILSVVQVPCVKRAPPAAFFLRILAPRNESEARTMTKLRLTRHRKSFVRCSPCNCGVT